MNRFSADELERRFPEGTVWRDRTGRYTVMLPDGTLLSGAVLEAEMLAVAAPPQAGSGAAACPRCDEFEQALAAQRAQIAALSDDVRRLEAMLQQLLAR